MASHKKLRDDAYRAFSRNGLDPEIQVALDAEYREVDPIAQIVLTDDGYQEFAARYISKELTKLEAYQSGDPRDHPYDGTRERPMCTCNDRYCAFKEGRLTRSIRTAADPVDATRHEMHTHNGDPLVLQDLKSEYDDLCAEFDHRHRRIIICGKHGIHPDELDELGLGDDADGGDESETNTTATQAVADD